MKTGWISIPFFYVFKFTPYNMVTAKRCSLLTFLVFILICLSKLLLLKFKSSCLGIGYSCLKPNFKTFVPTVLLVSKISLNEDKKWEWYCNLTTILLIFSWLYFTSRLPFLKERCQNQTMTKFAHTKIRIEISKYHGPVFLSFFPLLRSPGKLNLIFAAHP